MQFIKTLLKHVTGSSNTITSIFKPTYSEKWYDLCNNFFSTNQIKLATTLYVFQCHLVSVKSLQGKHAVVEVLAEAFSVTKCGQIFIEDYATTFSFNYEGFIGC